MKKTNDPEFDSFGVTLNECPRRTYGPGGVFGNY